MKTVEYHPDGEAIGDYHADKRAREFLKSNADYIKVGSEVFITAVRVLIHDRCYPHTDVQFLFDGTVITPDVNGRLPVWPPGFCQTYDNALERLLSASPSYPINPL